MIISLLTINLLLSLYIVYKLHNKKEIVDINNKDKEELLEWTEAFLHYLNKKWKY